MRHGIRASLVGFIAIAAFCNSPPLQAQQSLGYGLLAMAVVAYDASEAECHYEPIVGSSVRRMEDVVSSGNPRRWDYELDRATAQLPDSQGFMGAMGAQSPCVGYGMMIAQGLGLSIFYVGASPELLAESQRLENGGGRPR